MKKIAVGDLGEFWYGDYKEPFEQLEGAVPGHPVGVVLKADDGKLLCAYCGKTYDNLGRHVSATHRMSAREYKQEVGLLQKSALVSEKGRRTRIANGRRLVETGRAEIGRKPWKKGAPRPDAVGRANHAWTPESLNKTGRCYAQVLAVARSIHNDGKRVTQRSMKARGIGDLTIRTYFGGWEGLRAVIGQDDWHKRTWSDEALLLGFRSLAEKLGRAPTQSDLNRYGLPSTIFQRRFGGLAATCQKVGIPPNLPTPHDDEWAIRVLTAYAVIGRTDRTAEHIGTTHKAVRDLFARYGCPIPMHAKNDGPRLRREWAAMMARRLSGLPDEVAA